MSDVLLTGWGRTAPTRASLRPVRADGDVAAALRDAGPRGVLARGLGRSYGDAAQNAGGVVLAMDALARVHGFDGDRVTVDAGVSLDALIDAALPRGLFPAVVPGTAQVTVGGAIAADIHGKNHHRDGSFCRHVESLELATPAGEVLVCRPGDDAFAATAGGMGLTGVVLRATLRLARVPSAFVRVDVERARDLDDLMARMTAGDGAYRYSVAWIDCLARGGRLGRGVLLRGDHADGGRLERRRRPRLAAPPWAPGGLLSRWSVAAFNEAYFRRARPEQRVESLDAYFFPLDALRGWNVLYGPGGLVQYQLAVPFGAEAALRACLERLGGAGVPAFLAVLKRFGAQDGLLSFPLEGWTLALDVPARTPGLDVLLDGLDELVAGAGGRVYLAKDARLRRELAGAMYPGLERWRAVRDRLDPGGAMQSDLARRLGL